MTVDEPGKAKTATTDDSGTKTRPSRPGGHRATGSGSDAARGAGGTGGTGGGWAAPEVSRSRRLLTTALTALAIAIGAAVVLGLVVAFLTRDVGSTSKDPAAGTPSLVIPAGDAPSAGGSGAVPADWTEQTTSSGLGFKAPPGWTQRTDAVVDYRVDPSGPEQLGVGLSSVGDADGAVTSYAQNTYRGQTAFSSQPAGDATGARGERGRQLTLTYTRQGTPVTVVVRALPTARGVVVISTRSASDNPQRAVQLADITDASLRLP